MSVAEIASLIEKGLSYKDISNRLNSKFPGEKGYLKRSIHRFCKENKINQNYCFSDTEIFSKIDCHLKEVKHFYRIYCIFLLLSF